MDAAASLPQARRIQQLQSQVYHDQTFLATTAYTARYAGSPEGFQHSHHCSSHDSVNLEHYGLSTLGDDTPSSDTSYEIDVDDWNRPFECGPNGAGSKGKGKSHGEYIGDADIYDFGGTYMDRDRRKKGPKKGSTDGAGHNDATGTPSDDSEPPAEDLGTGTKQHRANWCSCQCQEVGPIHSARGVTVRTYCSRCSHCQYKHGRLEEYMPKWDARELEGALGRYLTKDSDPWSAMAPLCFDLSVDCL